MGNALFCNTKSLTCFVPTTKPNTVKKKVLPKNKQTVRKRPIRHKVSESDGELNSYSQYETALEPIKSSELTNLQKKRGKNINTEIGKQPNLLLKNKPNSELVLKKPKFTNTKRVRVKFGLVERGMNTVPSIQNPLNNSRNTGILLTTLKKWIPEVTAKSNSSFIKNHFPKVVPYVSGAVLGFSQLKTSTEESNSWFRPRRKSEAFKNKLQFVNSSTSKFPVLGSGDSNVSFNPTKLHELEKHEGWWRYTMFVLQDPWEKSLEKVRLSENGGLFVGLETRTGCQIKFGDKSFVHRGKLVRQLFIDGPLQRDILRCKSSLPEILLKFIIQDKDAVFTNEPVFKKPDLLHLQPFSGIGVNWTNDT